MRVGLGIAVVLFAATASAEEHPNVRIEVDACVSAPADEVKKIVTVELGALVVETANGPTTDVRTACRGGLVELVVDDPITGKSLSRSVDILSSPPKARARLLALAIVELVSASWTELESNPKPRVPPAGPPVPESTKRAAKRSLPTREPTVRLLAFGEERFFFPRTGPLHGFGLRGGDDRWFVGWAADVTYSLGAVSAPLGSISADVVSAGLSANVHHATRVLSTRIGPGVRVGSARFSGVPRDDGAVEGRSVRGPWVEPFVQGSITLRPFSSAFSFDFGLEAGWVALPVHANVDGERRASASGASLAATFGFGIGL